ncbi:MAG TPA: hypothetical protein PKB14_21035 [Rubrivivax sp.]|nr:hypothetical protein [Rubrivivax sp.]
MMSFSLFLRPRYRDTLASRIGWRAEVCPPSLRQAPRSGWNRLWFWLLSPGPLQASPALNRLPPVRQDFLDSLSDIAGAAADSLSLRIDQARSLRELWHLRAELYHVVALSHSQREAEQRVSQLNRHFPTRAPRSGFVPLLS